MTISCIERPRFSAPDLMSASYLLPKLLSILLMVSTTAALPLYTS